MLSAGLFVAGMTAEFSGYQIIIAALMVLLSLSGKAASVAEQILRR
ncbi:hypothetical protein P0Y67_20600 [Photobacterium sp. SP02]